MNLPKLSWKDVKRALTVLKPPPNFSVSQWADAKRRLSSESSAEEGIWNTARAEYQRGIMDACGDPRVESVAVRTSAQVGKTEAILNCIGFFAEHDPSPMLFIEPTLDIAQAVSKDRVAPMIRDSPSLNAIFTAKGKDDTILHKSFLGGHLTLAGANSPSSLSSRPVRIVFFDEVDRFPMSAGTEGDPVTLGRARTKNYWNRKVIMTSTPTVKGASRIDQAFEEGDQRYFYVACPHCGHEQTLMWRNVKWIGGDSATARYYCGTFDNATQKQIGGCGAEWTEGDRMLAVSKGHWVAMKPFRGRASFHINELYSPWSALSIMVQEFLDAKHSRNVERMKAWTNLTLGESYLMDGDVVDPESLKGRLEEWAGIPVSALVFTLGIDIQDDRAEMELVGWGEKEESWSLSYDVIHGDPSTPGFWNDLWEYIRTNNPDVTCIDSGGHYTQKVYEFAKKHRAARVWAIKGQPGPKPVWPKKASRGVKGGKVYMVGVDSAKEVCMARLKLNEHGPGYCHFPVGRDLHYFNGLRSEICVTKMSRGFPVRMWERLPESTHNEPWDCRIYAYAAFISLNVRDWAMYKRRKATHAAVVEIAPSPPPQESSVPPPETLPPPAKRKRFRPGGGFVHGWKL